MSSQIPDENQLKEEGYMAHDLKDFGGSWWRTHDSSWFCDSYVFTSQDARKQREDRNQNQTVRFKAPSS